MSSLTCQTALRITKSILGQNYLPVIIFHVDQTSVWFNGGFQVYKSNLLRWISHIIFHYRDFLTKTLKSVFWDSISINSSTLSCKDAKVTKFIMVPLPILSARFSRMGPQCDIFFIVSKFGNIVELPSLQGRTFGS